MTSGAAPVIREGTVDDAAPVERIWEAVAAEGEWIGSELPLRAGWADRFRAAIADDDASWFVAEVGGEVVGAIYSRDDAGLAHVGMAIIDGYRGQGIGRRLLDRTIGWARERGCHKIDLEVWPHNTGARHLYRAAGFVDEGLRRRHYRRNSGALWDIVAMGLVLDEESPGRS